MTRNSPTHNELLYRLSRNPQNHADWEEFMRRFHRHICTVIARELKRHGWRMEAAATEQLAQRVYDRLLADSAQALHEYRWCDENSAYRYLEIIAIRVVLRCKPQTAASMRPN